MPDASGVYVIAVTPFHDDGRLDDDSAVRMVEFYQRCGASGLTILGVMGEATKLATEEAIGFARRVIAASGRMPVIVGVSAPGFAAMRALALSAMDAGAAGVMIAPPASVRTDDQVVGYYGQAVEAIGSDVPFVIQDYPYGTGVVMSVPAIRRIIAAQASCFMLKHEEWPGLEKLSAVRGLMQEGAMRRIPVLAGNGAVFLDFEMERGADGAMTGYAFPEMLADVVRLQKGGQARRGARSLRRPPAAAALRAAAGPRPGRAQARPQAEGRHPFRRPAQAGHRALTHRRAEVSYLLARLARHDARAKGLA